MNPASLRYTRSHEWIGMEDGLAVMGLSDRAQRTLGDITFVELPPVGRMLKRHEMLGVIESIKAANDLITPVAGKVAAVNEELRTTPELINRDPCGNGWICKLACVDAADLAELMTLAEYEVFLGTCRT
ncbi:MAG: glycine cleavage system protein GcvH [Kiritimatiellia bacterium]